MPTSIHQWTQCLHCKTRVYFCTRVARESNGASLTVVHERCVCVRVYARVYMNVYVCVQLHVYTILHVSSYEALRASVEVSAYSTRARTTHNTQHTTHNTHNTQHAQVALDGAMVIGENQAYLACLLSLRTKSGDLPVYHIRVSVSVCLCLCLCLCVCASRVHVCPCSCICLCTHMRMYAHACAYI